MEAAAVAARRRPAAAAPASTSSRCACICQAGAAAPGPSAGASGGKPAPQQQKRKPPQLRQQTQQASTTSTIGSRGHADDGAAPAAARAQLPAGDFSRVKKTEFVSSAVNLRGCPPDNRFPEFAVIGRSNVGKSSLINMLTSSDKLARVSKEPGGCHLFPRLRSAFAAAVRSTHQPFTNPSSPHPTLNDLPPPKA